MTRPRARSARAARLVSWLIGVALLSLGFWAISRAGVRPDSLWDALRAAPPVSLAALIVLITLTPACSSAMFWLLTRRYAPVPFSEQAALTLGAWLLNYLPMAPGLLGRLAYLRAVHGVPVRQGARVVIWANVLSMAAALALLALAAGGTAVVGPGRGVAALSLAAAGLLGAFAWYARVKRPEPDPQVWRLIAALAVRWLELHLWAARTWIVFDLVGAPLAWGGALALAAVGGVAVLFPLAPNGLGVREWAVALATPLLPASLAYSLGLTSASGLSAELLNRGCELLVAAPLGLGACAVVGARLRRHADRGASRRGDQSP